MTEEDREGSRPGAKWQGFVLSAIRDLFLVIAGAWAGVGFSGIALQNTRTATIWYFVVLFLIVLLAAWFGKMAYDKDRRSL